MTSSHKQEWRVYHPSKHLGLTIPCDGVLTSASSCSNSSWSPFNTQLRNSSASSCRPLRKKKQILKAFFISRFLACLQKRERKTESDMLEVFWEWQKGIGSGMSMVYHKATYVKCLQKKPEKPDGDGLDIYRMWESEYIARRMMRLQLPGRRPWERLNRRFTDWCSERGHEVSWCERRGCRG